MMPPMNTRLLGALPGHRIQPVKTPKAKKATPLWRRLSAVIKQPTPKAQTA